MEELYVRIAEYQKQMGYNFASYNVEKRMEAFRDYMAALLIEQGELARELPWKPWRPSLQQSYSSNKIISEEWIDCLFFLYDQALCLGLTKEDLRMAFETKMEKNMSRIASGYNSKPTEE